MKYKILQITFLLFVFHSMSFGQIPTPSNDIFVTNEVSINSDQLEFSPTFYEDGILFISTKLVNKKYKVTDKRIGKNIMSIFHSTRDDEGKLQKPKPFAIELLTAMHEGPLTFDRTADRMFFTRNNYKGKKRIKGSDGIIKLQIYTAERMDNVWKNVEKLPFNDRNSNAAHPSISVEGNELYFSSDRSGGLGGMDLYVSKKVGGEWGEPINLGPQINSEKDEVFPFIHADGTLYFSSNHHSGLGGLDIFTTKEMNGKWVTPENMGAPFNSSKDDFGIIIDRDKKNGYFSSARGGGIGQDDIYSFYALNGLKKNQEEISDFEKTITINVINETDGSVIQEAVVTYLKLDKSSLSQAITDLSSVGANPTNLVLKIPINENTTTGLTDYNGQIPIKLNRGNYVVKIEKEGFQAKQIAINSESEISEYNVPLSIFNGALANNGSGFDSNGNPIENGNGSGFDSNGNPIGNGNGSGFDSNGNPIGNGNGNGSGDPFVESGVVVSSTIEEGTIIELPNIYYNFNDASIRPDAQTDLEGLAVFLLKYPSTEIELLSHTDSRGTDRYNNRLSQRRAEEAVEYLIKKGIDRSRLTPIGQGESRLRNDCNDATVCSEEEHQYNRRTEVKITKMDAPITVKFINNYPSYISEAPNKYSGRSKNSSSSNSSSTSETNNVDYNPEGMYKVIAGAFANIKNAESRLVEVRDLGYNEADILQFGTKDLFYVVVSRYSSSHDAKKTVQSLEANSVHAFVKN